MKKCKIIGLTGQTGAGKSTVAKLFEGNGAVVISADSIVHKLYCEPSACSKAVAAVFGNDIINSDHTINRKFLAKKAFSSKENTRLLNSVVHPFVMYEMLLTVKSELENGASVIVYDAPQLFESNSELLCDVVVSVTARTDIRLDRICKRDNISREFVLERMNAQLSEDFFRENSDYVIENNSDTDFLKKESEKLIKTLVQR